MTGNPWSLEISPLYNKGRTLEDGPFTYFYDDVLKALRVVIKSGTSEVIVFHAVRPEPPSPEDTENYMFSYRRMVDPDDNPHNLDLNPLAQLIADAELGRKVREAGLGLK